MMMESHDTGGVAPMARAKVKEREVKMQRAKERIEKTNERAKERGTQRLRKQLEVDRKNFKAGGFRPSWN